MNRMQPKGAWLTVNRKCNFRCKWCYAEGTSYNHQKAMDFKLAKELTLLIYDLGIRNLRYIGGEPTLWKYLLPMNKFCRELGVKSIVVTNAMRFGIDSFWSKYITEPCDSAGISIKAGDPQQLSEVARIQNFDLVKKGISRYIETYNNNYGIGITYNSYYFGNLPKLIEFAVECGARSVKIDFCATTFKDGKPHGTFMVEPREMVRDIVGSYDKIDKILNSKVVFEMNFPFCLWPEDFIDMLKSKGQIYSVCQLLKRHGLIFDTDGQLLMCNGLFDYPIGHYKKDFDDAATLLAYLNNKTNTRFYNQLSAYPSQECIKCDWYVECAGGCPLRWSLYKPDDYLKAQKNEGG